MFNLEEFIRHSGCREFKMTVVSDDGEELEMEIETAAEPKKKFYVYIERNTIFGKHALDGFRKHLGQYLKKPSHRERTDELFKSMIGRRG